VPAAVEPGGSFLGFFRKRWWASAIGLLLISFVGYNFFSPDNSRTIASEDNNAVNKNNTIKTANAPVVSSIETPQKSDNNSDISSAISFNGKAQNGTTWGGGAEQTNNKRNPEKSIAAAANTETPQNIADDSQKNNIQINDNDFVINSISASPNASGPAFVPSENFGAPRGNLGGNDLTCMAYSPLYLNPASDGVYGVSLYYNGLYSLSENERSLEFGNSPFVSEFNAGIYLDAAANFKIGFEIGRESFGHIYTSDATGQSEFYDQKPLIFCLGVGARYEMNYLEFMGARPFVHASYASTELGHLGRGTIGVEYITPQRLFFGGRLGINVGLEGSMMLYETRDSKWLTAKKNGIVLGGAIHF
jgi:hypothetical protein